LAGGLQVRSDSRYPATANVLTNAGGTATEVHSLAETQRLGSTEFPRRTVPILASRHDKTPMFAIRSVDFSCFSIVAGKDSPNI
jgi:hypothetical protein